MNDLSKQQLVLLALLVSFVTSLATGIVTVSLMDQAPQGVTRTITQIVERTINAVPQDAAVAVSREDTVSAAVKAASASTVKLRNRSDSSMIGIGVVISRNGIVVTDRSVVAQATEYTALLSGGMQVPMSIIRSQIGGDLVFLAPNAGSPNSVFSPFSFATSTELGQSIFSLSGTTTPVLGQGIITATDSSIIGTSISPVRLSPGSPIFDINGLLVGLSLSSLPSTDGASAYPAGNIKQAAPSI